MNFFSVPNNGEFIIPDNGMIPMFNPVNGENLFYKINELENKLKKLEQRIIKLENENNTNNFPDNSMYML